MRTRLSSENRRKSSIVRNNSVNSADKISQSHKRRLPTLHPKQGEKSMFNKAISSETTFNTLLR